MFNGGRTPPHYGLADYDAAGAGGDRMNPVGGSVSPFPLYAGTRFNYATPTINGEFANHPSQFTPDYYTSAANATGRTFSYSDQRRLGTRYGDKPENYAKSDLGKLAPQHLVSANYTGGPFNTTNPTGPVPPWTPNPGFTSNDLANLVRMLTTNSSSSISRPELIVYGPPLVPGGPPQVLARLGPIDLNKTLPGYLIAGQAWTPDGMLSFPPLPGQPTQVQNAVVARQLFARDIMLRLVVVADMQGRALGQPLIDYVNIAYDTVPIATALDPRNRVGHLKALTPTGINILQAFAQYAVNIVDYIDSDDISTVFVWNPYIGGVFFDPTTGVYPFATGQEGSYLVVGTELPRLVANEAYAAVVNDRNDKGKNKANLPLKVQFWLELHNPLNNDPNLPENASARLHYDKTLPLSGMATQPQSFSPYQIHILESDPVAPAGTVTNQLATSPTNVFGDPALIVPATPNNRRILIGKPGQTDYAYDPSAPKKIDPLFDPSMGGNLDSFYHVLPAAGAATGTPRQNQGYYVLGPQDDFPGQDAGSYTGAPPGQQGSTLRTADPAGGGPHPSMMIDVGGAPSDANVTQEVNKRWAVVLRRLANPYLQPQPDPTNPAAPYNPYITVDIFDGIQPRDQVRLNNNNGNNGNHNGQGMGANGIDNSPSMGRKHPYAASRVEPQGTAAAMGINTPNTLFMANALPPAPPSLDAPLRWLTHLDRQLTSPVEMVHASAVSPTMLTTQFANAGGNYNLHTAEKMLLPGVQNGLSRFANYTTVAPATPPDVLVAQGFLAGAFDFLTVRSPVGSTPVGGREYGRLNINTTWHRAVLRALLDGRNDANAANYFTDAEVDAMWDRMNPFPPTGTTERTIKWPDVDVNDRPFQGTSSLVTRGYTAGVRPPVFNNINGLANGAGDPTHTYVQAEPLRKMWQMTSTTSNTFTVIMTVGFFEVRGQVYDNVSGTNRVYLGKELFQNAPGDLRQKFVSVVDRSYIAQDATFPTAQTAEKPWFTTLTEDVAPGATSFKVAATAAGLVFADGQTFSLTGRNSLRLGFGDNLLNQADGEAVNMTGALPVTPFANGVVIVNLPVGSTVARYHPAGSPVSNVLLGNPGPQPGFDYRIDRYKQTVIPYCVKVSGP